MRTTEPTAEATTETTTEATTEATTEPTTEATVEPTTEATVDCCIAGGGPAGMVLGLLLARQGLRVVVLERHADFLRDFRGDTVHPSTLRLLDELGPRRGLPRPAPPGGSPPGDDD